MAKGDDCLQDNAVPVWVWDETLRMVESENGRRDNPVMKHAASWRWASVVYLSGVQMTNKKKGKKWAEQWLNLFAHFLSVTEMSAEAVVICTKAWNPDIHLLDYSRNMAAQCGLCLTSGLQCLKQHIPFYFYFKCERECELFQQKHAKSASLEL